MIFGAVRISNRISVQMFRVGEEPVIGLGRERRWTGSGARVPAVRGRA